MEKSWFSFRTEGEVLRQALGRLEPLSYFHAVWNQSPTASSNPLLQLADMVCGSIARDHNKPGEGARYRKINSHREVHVQVWPK